MVQPGGTVPLRGAVIVVDKVRSAIRGPPTLPPSARVKGHVCSLIAVYCVYECIPIIPRSSQRESEICLKLTPQAVRWAEAGGLREKTAGCGLCWSDSLQNNTTTV